MGNHKEHIIKDNTPLYGTVAEFLKQPGLISEKSHLSIVSAYFTAYAYDALRHKLDMVDKVRFLFGEPTFLKNSGTLPKRAFNITDDGLDLSQRLKQTKAAKDCAAWLLKDNIEIKSMRDNCLLHGKLYFIKEEGNPKDKGEAIFGSSNFTCRGLGLIPSDSNIELNMVVDSDTQRYALMEWFNNLWSDNARVEDVKAQVLEALQMVYSETAPETVYLKTLYHIFAKRLGEQQLSDAEVTGPLEHSRIWQTLYPFQRDGVKGALRKIEAFNGCILADSVGLGKTYEALAVIKYYERKKLPVLVLCPKKLCHNWMRYRNNDTNNELEEKFEFDLFFHTDLGRKTKAWDGRSLSEIRWDQYGLVVIDESHNFRNTGFFDADETGKLSRYMFLFEKILKSNGSAKVLLLSATPVNNSLSDLRNQFNLITAGQEDVFRESLGIANLSATVNRAQAQFLAWSRNKERKVSELMGLFSGEFLMLLDALTIARSRHHIMVQYAEDSSSQLWKFPGRLNPVSLYPAIDSADDFMSFDKIVKEINGFKLAVYNPTSYLKPEFVALYEKDVIRGFTQAGRELYLIGMIKMNLLKRLESSVEAFEMTLKTMLGRISNARDKIRDYQNNPENASDLELDLNMDDPDKVFDGKFKIKLSHLRLDDYAKALKSDADQLRPLYDSASRVIPERDAKLAELRRIITEKALTPTTDRDGKANRKVLVFTAFADTAKYLYHNLADSYQKATGCHTALVTGSDTPVTSLGKPAFDHILVNFSPLSNRRAERMDATQGAAGFEHGVEIDLLIGTDCISEGQNLQDCDMCINYDVHWNPVRLIQRFGRIDRLGSRNDKVQMITFWPMQELDHYLQLQDRVVARMDLVDATGTGSDNVLKEANQNSMIDADTHFRMRQLQKLRDDGGELEGEDSDTLTLANFSLSPYSSDLTRHLDKDRQWLADLPLGLYAVTAATETVRPGVIFCLRQNQADAGQEKVNPLTPYFLVYVSRDGNVINTFAQSTKTLETFKALCLGQTRPDLALCSLFNEETKQGADMSRIAALLTSAVKSIRTGLDRKNAVGLATDASFVLPLKLKPIDETGQLELITWLAVIGPKNGSAAD